MLTMTKQEIINNFVDCEVDGFESYVIDNFRAEIQENEAEAEKEYNVSLAGSGELYDTDGNGTYLNIEGKTYEILSTDNCFTIGYVYEK